MQYRLLAVVLALAASFTAGCGGAGPLVSDGPGSSESITLEQNVGPLYQVEELVFDVLYEPGAEPFFTTMRDGRSIWALAGDNMTALFQDRAHKPRIGYPTELSQTRPLNAQNRNSWTADDILNLGLEVKAASPGAITVLFLRGHFSQNGKTQPQTLGVQVTGTTVIAIFKDAIRASNTSNPTGLVARYMEQATIIHEAGHALGLVNHGVPQTSEHHAHEHGAHCTNPDCVMYFQNGGAASLASFVARMVETSSTVMFGDECLADTAAFRP